MTIRDLPAETPVSYSRQYRRCGKAACLVCGPGGPGHGPYWYAFWREGGRKRSRYLGREAPPGVVDGSSDALAGSAAARADPKPPQVQETGLRVRTLGGFTVWLGDEMVPAARWHRPMVAALFKALLSVPGHRLARDQALETLWPEAGPQQGAVRLRATIHRLRQVVGAGHLAYGDEVLALTPGAGGTAWLDADAFEALARAALDGRDTATCRAALALYSGDYLPEDRYADWAVERREDLRQRWMALLLHTAALCEEAGEIEEADRHLRITLTADRCQEEAARALMQLHARAGRPAQALRVYRRLADALRDELDLAPEPQTRALYRALAAQRQANAPTAPEPVRLTNLPASMTSFIGRRQELAGICGLLTGGSGAAPDPDTRDREAPCRLLTLVGPGGVGKTRLALAAADDMLDEYPDGVWLVDLAPLAGAAAGGAPLVVGTVVRALGLAEEPGRAPLETLTAAVRDKHMLVVLDNCEHLIDACAELAARLLADCPALRILATSRERLEVAGERAWPVPPLSLPDAQEATAGRLPRSEAVRLFLERARSQRPDLVLTDENAATIAQICARLAGIPLAIELAAARAGMLSLEAIAARLAESLRLLAGGPRTAPSRQRTLRATLDWSWDLLEEGEQALLRRLSVFAGGWALGSAEAVGAGDGLAADGVLDLLAGLGRKSLLLMEDREGQARYGLLEMVRQYGLERLAEAGETDRMRSRHLAHYLALVEQADAALRGPEQAAWLARLEAEHHNLRAALTWAHERGEAEQGLRLVGVLARFWQARGYLAEGRRWVEDFLRLPQDAPDTPLSSDGTAVRARALRGAGILAVAQGDYGAALAWYEESLGLLQALGDRRGVAMIRNNQALVATRQGDFRRAEALFEESLALLRELDERPLIAMALNSLGVVARDMGDLGRAALLQEEALAIQRELGDTGNAADSLFNLGALAFDRGHYQQAWKLLGESLTMQQALGNTARIALVTHGLGAVALRRGEYARAQQLAEEALAMRRELGDRSGLAHSLNDLGVVALQQGDLARAKERFQEALATRRELGELAAAALSTGALALVAAQEGNDGEAEALFDEAIALARERDYRAGIAWTLADRGWVAVWRGDHARAEVLLVESLGLLRELGDRFWIASCLEGLAAVACHRGQPARAARLLSAAAALREALGTPLLPTLRATSDRTLAETRAALGAVTFAEEWAAGRALSTEAAIEVAIDATEDRLAGVHAGRAGSGVAQDRGNRSTPPSRIC